MHIRYRTVSYEMKGVIMRYEAPKHNSTSLQHNKTRYSSNLQYIDYRIDAVVPACKLITDYSESSMLALSVLAATKTAM